MKREIEAEIQICELPCIWDMHIMYLSHSLATTACWTLNHLFCSKWGHRQLTESACTEAIMPGPPLWSPPHSNAKWQHIIDSGSSQHFQTWMKWLITAHGSWHSKLSPKRPMIIIWKCGGANSLWSKGWPSANRKTEEIPKSYEMIQGIVCPDSLFGNSHVVKQTYLLITCHCETMASVVMVCFTFFPASLLK